MAINGKSNIDGNFLAVNGNSNLDGTSPLYRDRPPVRCFYVGKFTEHLPEFLTCPSVESYGRLYVKTEISPFSYYTETRRTTYQVPVPRIYTFTKQQFPADTPIVLLYERVTPLESSHGHHLPNKCRFCARNSRTLFRPQASADRTRMHGVLGESRASCRLSYYYEGRIKLRRTAATVRGARQRSLRWFTHIHRIVPPSMPYREFLAEGRASLNLYATASVCARNS